MKHATNLRDTHLSTLPPGISINTGSNDYAPIKQMQMMQFTGKQWRRFGPVLNGQAAAS